MPRRVRSSSSMISMARTLGAPETVPAGKQAIKAIHVFAQAPAQVRNDVHNVRVALDGEELFDLDGAVLADAAKIISAEVHEHDVLGTLFFTGEHFAFEALILGFVLTAA